MNFLHEILFAYPILSLLQTAFMVWMLVDAYKRRVEHFWFWIIFFLPVIGAWVYFIAIMAPHLGAGTASTWFQPRVSLAELRHRAAQAPTLANNLALGQALLARGDVDEALPALEAAHKVEPEHGSVLFALAECHAGKDPEQAAAFLERIIAREPRWSDYEAWRLLVQIHAEAGHSQAALDKARQLVQLAPTIQHKCILGELLIAQGQGGEARNLLDRALDDHAFAPSPIRRRNRPWAKQAGKLLKRIG